jgi:uncharacterized protein (TIGR03437 family)
MLYTSINQIGAIMPSNAPEGDGTLVVSYQNLASTSVPIRVVRSAVGVFTRNQAGTGPVSAHNFVSQTLLTLNSLVSSATPGQTVILWGTGLGPVTGDETAGPLPGALPFLDSLYVGGVQANVRYAGRSGCCAGIDQIIFDVPAGISGCYVPVAAVTGGVISNVGTISIASSTGACDDPLDIRSSTITTALRNGTVRTGQVNLTGLSSSEVDVNGAFTSTDLDTFLADAARVNPPAGICSLAVSRVDLTAARVGTGLNAGDSIVVSGPPGTLSAANTSSGAYSMAKSPATLTQGSYSINSGGGSDVGPFSATLNFSAPATWTNMASYSVSAISAASPFTFTWTGGDPSGYVTLRVSSANALYNSEVRCNVAGSAGSFTIPAWLASAIYAGPVTVSLTSNSAPLAFSATGLDAGTITVASTSAVQTVLQPLAQ